MTVKLLTPLTITDTRLTATDVPENDYAAWNAATAYPVGQRVIRTTTHRIYERLVAGTTATAPESDAVNWLDVGATNRWRAFDTRVSSQTTQATSFYYTITPGQVVNAVGCINVSASTVRVQVIDPLEGSVYDTTRTMQDPPLLADWYNYFFDPIVSDTQALFLDLPSYGSAAITITFTAPVTAGCGALLMGRLQAFGIEDGAQQGARVGILDYSRKERNDFGDIELVERLYSDRANIDILVPNTQLDYARRLLASVRATPTLWVGSDLYESTVIYGFCKDFSLTIAYENYSQCALELESLT